MGRRILNIAKTRVVNDKLAYTLHATGVTLYLGRLSDGGKAGAYATLSLTWRVFDQMVKDKERAIATSEAKSLD
jgi:hypothetical protein